VDNAQSDGAHVRTRGDDVVEGPYVTVRYAAVGGWESVGEGDEGSFILLLGRPTLDPRANDKNYPSSKIRGEIAGRGFLQGCGDRGDHGTRLARRYTLIKKKFCLDWGNLTYSVYLSAWSGGGVQDGLRGSSLRPSNSMAVPRVMAHHCSSLTPWIFPGLFPYSFPS
jgi:hypothetical protein